MKVIVPCAGKSSRFPNMRPKWMLTHPDGNLMVKKALEGLRDVRKEDIIITILREHEEKYDIVQGLKENIGQEITVVVLDEETKSESETVYETLKKANVNESFLVREGDNAFEVEARCFPTEYNYICYSNLDEYEEINAKNKSYIIMNEQGVITDMVEKKVVSQSFNVGGYFFKDSKKFMEIFERLNGLNNSELYLSHIVKEMICNEKEIFLGKRVKNYHDWGTAKNWLKYCNQFKTYFFDIDGVLLKNSAQFSNPRWENAEPIEENLEVIKKLSESEYVQLFFVTARPEKYREWIENKLRILGIKYSGLIMGCLHAERILINDFSNTTGYPNCSAINIPRDSKELGKYLGIDRLAFINKTEKKNFLEG